tara:strand:- start:814 stop:1542 length:729 start_codon:yes stop_codon:yes gene_type:complete
MNDKQSKTFISHESVVIIKRGLALQRDNGMLSEDEYQFCLTEFRVLLTKDKDYLESKVYNTIDGYTHITEKNHGPDGKSNKKVLHPATGQMITQTDETKNQCWNGKTKITGNPTFPDFNAHKKIEDYKDQNTRLTQPYWAMGKNEITISIDALDARYNPPKLSNWMKALEEKFYNHFEKIGVLDDDGYLDTSGKTPKIQLCWNEWKDDDVKISNYSGHLTKEAYGKGLYWYLIDLINKQSLK